MLSSEAWYYILWNDVILRNLGNHDTMSSFHEAEGQFRHSNYDSVLMSRFDNHGFLSGRPMATIEAHGTLQSHSYVYD